MSICKKKDFLFFFRKEVRTIIQESNYCPYLWAQLKLSQIPVSRCALWFITASGQLTDCRISNLSFLTTCLSEEWSDFPHWGRPNRIWCEAWPWALLYCLPIFHIALNLDLLKSTANLSLFYIQMSADCARNFPTRGSDANIMLLFIK